MLRSIWFRPSFLLCLNDLKGCRRNWQLAVVLSSQDGRT
ncbi:hypothetical protein OROHE_024510 [Orobanche hederae]